MPGKKPKLLLVGSNGMLARAVAAQAPLNYDLHAVDLPEFDITDQEQVVSIFDSVCPDIVINCAAYTNVDGCETEQELADRVNGAAVGYLAQEAKKIDAILVHVSTDYVFDGKKKTPYVEDDEPNPQSVYGHSKLLGEQAILESGLEKFFIIRTSWLYGPGGNNFVETVLRLAAEREELGIIDDQIGTPTYTGDLADAIFNLLALSSPRASASNNGDSPHSGTAPYGIYHFSNDGQCSWYDFSRAIVTLAQQLDCALKVKKIRPIRTEEYPLPAKRPSYSVFSKNKYCLITGASIPEWQESLKRYFRER
jgi:dTDP-4-dehydrorhamnose reductase